jgi:hypothetical protein
MLPVTHNIIETLTYYCKHTQILEEVLFTMKIFSSTVLLIAIIAPSMVVEAGCKKEGQDF